MMEEATANVRIEVNESLRRDVTPNQMISREEINVSATTDEVIENPEYVVVRRSTTVQAVASEEIVIPRQDSALAQNSDATVPSSENAGSMEMDISSQESAMDIASQESLPVKESNTKEPSSSHRLLSEPFTELGDDLLSPEEALQNLKKMLACKNPVKRKKYLRIERLEGIKRKRLIEECKKRLKLVEEVLDQNHRNALQLQSDIYEVHDYFARENYLSDHEEEQESDGDDDYPDPPPCLVEDDFPPCSKRAKKG